MPDLGELAGADLDRQHIVDHGFVLAENGNWQLWACIRGTAVGRLLYRWEGESLERGPWEPRGIAARADARFGEATDPEKMQAPFFLKEDDRYLLFYNSAGIRLMTSDDGVHYTRAIGDDGSNVLYEAGGRDVTVNKEGGRYFAYSTVSTVARDGWKYGFIILRTSPDLERWSDYTIVSSGGRAGNGPVSAESPTVVKIDGYYYLFRSSSMTGTTFVYRSRSRYDFGVNSDAKLIAELPVKAPGIKLARLRWN